MVITSCRMTHKVLALQRCVSLSHNATVYRSIESIKTHLYTASYVIAGESAAHIDRAVAVFTFTV